MNSSVKDYSEVEIVLTYINQLSNPETRENALLELSKKRETVPSLAPMLWQEFHRFRQQSISKLASLLGILSEQSQRFFRRSSTSTRQSHRPHSQPSNPIEYVTLWLCCKTSLPILRRARCFWLLTLHSSSIRSCTRLRRLVHLSICD